MYLIKVFVSLEQPDDEYDKKAEKKTSGCFNGAVHSLRGRR